MMTTLTARRPWTAKRIGDYPSAVLLEIACARLVPSLTDDECYAIRRLAVAWLQMLGFSLRRVCRSQALPARAIYPCAWRRAKRSLHHQRKEFADAH